MSSDKHRSTDQSRRRIRSRLGAAEVVGVALAPSVEGRSIGAAPVAGERGERGRLSEIGHSLSLSILAIPPVPATDSSNRVAVKSFQDRKWSDRSFCSGFAAPIVWFPVGSIVWKDFPFRASLTVSGIDLNSQVL